MFGKLIKILLVLLVVFGIVWLSVIAFWQTSNSDPGGTDIVLWLFALPVALIASFFAIKAGIKFARKRADKRAEEEKQNGAKAQEFEQGSPDNPEDAYTLNLIDAAIRLPIGADPAEVTAVLAEGATRPGLDDELIDDQGFPVFAARVPDLQEDDLQDSLGLPEHYRDTPLAWTPEQLRALSLAAEVLDQMAAGTLSQVLASAKEAQAERIGEPLPAEEEVVSLKLALCLPSDWQAAFRDAARDWLSERLMQIEWPPERIVVDLVESDADTRPLAYVDQLSIDLNRQEINSLCLMLACGSAIGEASVARLDGEGRLFSQANPKGVIPAEGAAGFLLATEAVTERLQPENWARIHRAALARRDKSADSKGAISGDLLNTLAEHALRCASHPAEKICCILADAGLQPGQSIETGVLTAGEFNHLDATSECLKLSAACGNLGAVATVAVVALAHTHCLTEEKPVLVLGIQHGLDRAALVVQPNIDKLAPVDDGDEDNAAQDDQNEPAPAESATA